MHFGQKKNRFGHNPYSYKLIIVFQLTNATLKGFFMMSSLTLILNNNKSKPNIVNVHAYKYGRGRVLINL